MQRSNITLVMAGGLNIIDAEKINRRLNTVLLDKYDLSMDYLV